MNNPFEMIQFGEVERKYKIWDRIRYAGPGLNQLGWLKTRSAQEIMSSEWSVGCETLDRDYADFQEYKEYVGTLGVKRARLQSGWAKTEKTKGVYDFTWLDIIISDLEAMEVRPWVTLCYGNPLYGSDIQLGSKVFSDENTMRAWVSYVSAVVRRYEHLVFEWEVWNEPNLREGTYDTGHEEYANLLMHTASAIRDIQPEAKIIGFSLAKVALTFARNVFEILKANNKLEFVDYLSFHPYTYNPDDSYAEVKRLQALVNEYRPEIQLFQGENGCPSNLEYTHALSHYPWTEISQAKWLLRRMAGDRMRGIPTSVFTMIDLRYPDMLQSFGLIRANLQNKVIYKRPSYYAVQHMASFFDDNVSPCGELNYSANAYRQLTVGGFNKADKKLFLVWYKDRIPGDKLEWELVKLRVPGHHFEQPVYADMLSGKVFEIGKADWNNDNNHVNFHNLPLWDSVIMIAERSQVECWDEFRG